MGPVGTPSNIPNNKIVLLIGKGIGNLILLPLLSRMKINGCYIICILHYKNSSEITKKKYLENYSDSIIWVHNYGKSTATRSLDYVSNINISSIINLYKNGFLNRLIYPLYLIDYMFISGDFFLLSEIKKLSDSGVIFNSSMSQIVTSYSPMQCMMKEICSQCIQKHYDFKTKKKYLLFSCVEQNQYLKSIDISFLHSKFHEKKFFTNVSNISLGTN
jgi:hypothetical protein